MKHCFISTLNYLINFPSQTIENENGNEEWKESFLMKMWMQILVPVGSTSQRQDGRRVTTGTLLRFKNETWLWLSSMRKANDCLRVKTSFGLLLLLPSGYLRWISLQKRIAPWVILRKKKTVVQTVNRPQPNGWMEERRQRESALGVSMKRRRREWKATRCMQYKMSINYVNKKLAGQ